MQPGWIGGRSCRSPRVVGATQDPDRAADRGRSAQVSVVGHIIRRSAVCRKPGRNVSAACACAHRRSAAQGPRAVAACSAPRAIAATADVAARESRRGCRQPAPVPPPSIAERLPSAPHAPVQQTRPRHRHWRRPDPRRCPSDSRHRHCLRVRRARRMSNRIPSGPGSRRGKGRMHSVHSAGRNCRQAALHATRRHRARSPARTPWAGSWPSPPGENRSKRYRSRHPAVPPASV